MNKQLMFAKLRASLERYIITDMKVVDAKEYFDYVTDEDVMFFINSKVKTVDDIPLLEQFYLSQFADDIPVDIEPHLPKLRKYARAMCKLVM